MPRNRSRRLPPPSPIPFRHGLGGSLEALRAALGCLGVPASTADLAGFSGASFRLYWRRPPASVWDAEIVSLGAFDPLAVASETHGWKLLRYREATPEVAWQFAVQSIDGGRPVLAGGLLREDEMQEVLLIGYRQEEGSRLVEAATPQTADPVAIPWPGGEPGLEAAPLSIGLFEPVAPHRRVDRTESIHRALRRAVWVAEAPPRRGAEGVAVGREGYRAWIAAMLRPDREAAASEAERLARRTRLRLPPGKEARGRVAIRHVLHRSLSAYAEAREWAVSFLESLESRHPIEEAIDRYRVEASALREAQRLWPAVLAGAEDRLEIAPEPAGFEPGLWLEETVRCLRIAEEAYAAATAAVDRAVPMLDQERVDPDADESEGLAPP